MKDQKGVEQRRRVSAVTGQHFVGTWKITAGSPLDGSDKKYEMRIVPAGTPAEPKDTLYFLQYRVVEPATEKTEWTDLQELVFLPDTQTLENRVAQDGCPRPDEPERCIAFWDRRVRNRAPKCSIFAIRVGKNPPHLAQDESLPPFETGSNGSWTAEEGGGG